MLAVASLNSGSATRMTVKSEWLACGLVCLFFGKDPLGLLLGMRKTMMWMKKMRKMKSCCRPGYRAVKNGSV